MGAIHSGLMEREHADCPGDLELISSNPVKRGTAPKLEKTEKPILTETQLNALFGLVHIHYKAFFMTLAMTGIRTGEALGLKWADVDFAEREIHVRRAIYRGKETTPKTVSSKRSRPMVEKLYRALLNHRAISAYTTQADYGFASSTGHPFNPDQLREALRGALGKLGVQMDQKHVRNAPASAHHRQRCVQAPRPAMSRLRRN